MVDKAQKTWIQTGLLLSLGLALTFIFRGKWRLARIAGGFAAAFISKWRDKRMADKVHGLLSKAGGKP